MYLVLDNKLKKTKKFFCFCQFHIRNCIAKILMFKKMQNKFHKYVYVCMYGKEFEKYGKTILMLYILQI